MTRIRRLLVANRGEIARRVMRTARRMGIETVAVFSEPDVRAPHAREADVAVPVTSYLEADELIAAAARTDADALHPGYGFLSESADFAQACIDAGLTWVGPAPESMRAMADKISARRLAAELGVPVLPGGAVETRTDPSLAALAESVGLPLLVKASAGGGGRGMRRVVSADELAAAIEAAEREAAAAFGDSKVFLEREIQNARHIEVQVFGDQHGKLVHLFERECSIQRRHQKLIEEAPAICLPASTRAGLCEAALTLARGIGYSSAGTVEFLLEHDGLSFKHWFLEMNTRLQVEHAVTEAITGLDLVELQLRVAMGEPLEIDQADVACHGHAIEARLYAEDPARAFLPSGGRLNRFEVARADGLRWDSGVESGSQISTYYDGLLTKAIAHAPARAEAAARLAAGLRRAQVHGPVTNRDCLIAILESDAFRAGNVSTQWLAEQAEVLAAGPPRETRQRHALAAALVLRQRRRGAARALAFAPGGWRNVPSADQRSVFEVGGDTLEVTYAVAADGGALRASIAGGHIRGRVHAVHDDTIDLQVDGVRAQYGVHTEGSVHYVNDARWQSVVEERPRFPDADVGAIARGPAAPVPGSVVSVHVEPGQHVAAGDVLVVLDAMKIEHQVLAEFDARVVDVCVAPGERVDAHQVLVVLEA